MIKIYDFTASHIEEASKIALMNYHKERAAVPALPALNNMPSLEDYAKNNRGVAAMEGDKLLGFFCWHQPWDGLFGLSKGTCVEAYAHGAIKPNRAEIYDRLYQAAAKRLVADDVFSHCVILYEHDEETNYNFAQNGFGRRCVDAIRETTPIPVSVCESVTFRQAGKEDAEFLTVAGNGVGLHLSRSPMFMPYSGPDTVDDTLEALESGDYLYFIALEQDRPVAYLCLKEDGEHFAASDASVMNICGAYALPEVRGRGVSAGLLSWLMDWLRERGFSRCGVDYECFNYASRKFWPKYFMPYTNGATRRIDERINAKL